MDLSLVTIALISGASEYTGAKEYVQFRMSIMKSKYFEYKFDDTVNFRFKHVRFKEVFPFKEEFHCSQNLST